MLIIILGFLTAMRQEVSRAHEGWPLDTVTLQNDVTQLTREAVKDAPKVGKSPSCTPTRIMPQLKELILQ